MLQIQGPYGPSYVSGAIEVVKSNYAVQDGVEKILCDASQGAITITIPLSSQNQSRTIKVQKTDSTANAVTIALSAPDTALTNRTLVLYNQYGTVELGSNGSTGWALLGSSRLSALQQTSSASGSFSTTTTTLSNVTNLSITLTTLGNPVQLYLTADGTNIADLAAHSTANGDAAYQAAFARGGTALVKFSGEVVCASSASLSLFTPPGLCNYVDPVAAGTYTYTFQVRQPGVTNGSVLVENCVLVGFELP